MEFSKSSLWLTGARSDQGFRLISSPPPALPASSLPKRTDAHFCAHNNVLSHKHTDAYVQGPVGVGLSVCHGWGLSFISFLFFWTKGALWNFHQNTVLREKRARPYKQTTPILVRIRAEWDTRFLRNSLFPISEITFTTPPHIARTARFGFCLISRDNGIGPFCI